MTQMTHSQAMGPGYPTPAKRKLRIYAFDPQASTELDTALINDAVIELPWETPWEATLEPGPINEYIEVVDYDPACDLLYLPVDLNDPLLLAQDGLPPSEGRPQFHQQMVFAVAMQTIRIFERALGRQCMWADVRAPDKNGKGRPDNRRFTQRLRIYPHALREANAYYSPDKVALLFGYFRKNNLGGAQDDGWVFTCLSQDIVAHETTHAILHGMHRRSIEPTSPDALAFHEAFSDIVALFQHFSMREVVEHELARARGSLRDPGLLNSLASQFGHATGRGGALRSAFDMMTVEASKKKATTRRLSDVSEPHERGQFLVAAIFDAFVTIYERRTADLLRIAGECVRTGGSFSPDLVTRLAKEACKAADHILRMCVRALDYIPPVDLQFGEYLRAIITADADLVPDDPLNYRVAVAEAFRNRGIFVPGVMSMTPDSLMWDEPDMTDLPLLSQNDELSTAFATVLGKMSLTVDFAEYAARRSDDPGRLGLSGFNRRQAAMRIVAGNQQEMWKWLTDPDEHDIDWERLLGIKLHRETKYVDADRKKRVDPAPGGIKISPTTNEPAVEVHSVRVARRQGPDGQELPQLVVQVTQKRRGYFDEERQELADTGAMNPESREWIDPPFWFRGGATVLVDLRDGRVRRVIRKRIGNAQRLDRERQYRRGDVDGTAFSHGASALTREPFAFIHRGE